MAKPLDVLGPRLKVEFQGDYAGGILTDSIAGEQIAQSNTAARPAPATTPGGAGIQLYDGNDSFSTADALIDPRTNLATLAALPAFGTGQRLHYFIIKIPTVIEGENQFLWNFATQGILVGGYSGTLTVSGLDASSSYQQFSSDNRIDDDVWHRCIIICDEATLTTSMYVDGVLQSTTGPFGFGQPGEWGGSYIGCGSGIIGHWGRVGFAYTETSFSSTDIEDLDASLLSVINDAPTIEDILGDRLYRWLKDYTEGTWTCAVGGGNATTAVGVPAPTVATLPSGQTYPDFTSANNDALLAGAITGFPTYSNTNNYCLGLLLKIEPAQSGNAAFIIGIDSYNYYYTGSNLYCYGALSTSDLADGEWHRVIVRRNGTGSVIMTVDGVDQAGVGDQDFGDNWEGTYYGDRYNNAGYNLDGGIASVFFACDTTTAFTTDDIAALDDALLTVLGDESPSGEMSATISSTSNVTGTLTDASAPPSSAVKTPQDVLTTRLVVEFRGDLVDNVLTDAIAGEKLGRASAPVLPVSDTTPGGKDIVRFAGYFLASNDSSVSPSTNLTTLANLPAIGTGQRLLYFIIKAPPVVDNTFGYIWSFGTTDVMINGFGGTLRVDYKTGSFPRVESDINIDDDKWHRCIVIGDELNGLTYLIVDGVLQSATGAFVTGAPTDWGAVGINHGAIQGVIGQAGFAYTSTTFSAQDIVDLDTALISVIEGTRVPDVLGDRLVLYYGGNYIPSTGVWTPTIGTSELVQTTSGSRPALGTTPVGNNVLSLDGTNDFLTTVGNNTGLDRFVELQALPAVGTGQRLMCVNFKADPVNILQVLYRAGGSESAGLDLFNSGDYRFRVIGQYPNVDALSDNELNDGAWHRIIIIGDDASRDVTIYVDGVAQSTVGNFTTTAFGSPSEWGAYGFSFGQSGSFYWDGELGSLGFAYTDTTFSPTDIANLDNALNLLINVAPVQISATISGTSDIDATISSSGTPEVTIATILSSSPTTSFRWLKNYTAGTWTDEEGNGDAVQASVANQPAVGTTDGGQSYPDFDGAALPNHDVLVLPAWSSAPVHSSSHHAALGFLFRADSIPGAGGGAFIVVSQNYLHYINSDQKLNLASGAVSNDTVVGNGWHRAIVVKNGSTGVVTLYMNGVAQTATTTSDMDSDWRTDAFRLGERDASGNYRYDGGMASMFFAIDTTTAFSSQKITDLDEALRVVLEGDGDVGAIEASIDNTSTVSGTITASGQLACTIANTTSITANISGSLPTSITISGTSTVSAAVSSTGRLVSTVAGTTSITAAISSSGALSSTVSGTTSINAAIRGALPGSATIAGTSTVNATTSSVVPGSATIDGTSTVTAAIIASGRATATLTGTSTVDANSSSIVNRTATINNTSEVTGQITAIASGATTISGVANISATLQAGGTSTSTINGTSTVSAPIVAIGRIASTLEGTSTVDATTSSIIGRTATINNTSEVTAAIVARANGAITIAGTSTVNAAWEANESISSTIEATSTVNASIVAVGGISATLAGASTIDATTSSIISRTATINATSEVTAAMVATARITSTIPGTTTIAATLRASGTNASAITGTSTIAAAISSTGVLSTEVDGTSTVNAAITGLVPISAQIEGTSDLSATLDNFTRVAGTSTVNAAIRGSLPAVSSIAAAATTTAAINAVIPGQSSISATSGGTANLSASGRLASTPNGTTTISANVLGTARGSATLSGTANCVVVATGTILIESTIESNSTVNAAIVGRVNATSTISGSTTVQSNLSGRGAFVATVVSSSTATGSIAGSTTITSQVSGSSGVNATLALRAFAEALIVNNSNVLANIRGQGGLSSLLSGTVTVTPGQLAGSASGNALITGTSGIGNLIFTLQAAINSSSSLTGRLFNYLQDKKIQNIDLLDRSANHFPRTLIPEKLEHGSTPLVPGQPGAPPVYIPPTYNPSIQKSGQHLASPITPGKISKFVAPRVVAPVDASPPPVHDPSIQKSGQRLGLPSLPGKINKSNQSI